MFIEFEGKIFDTEKLEFKQRRLMELVRFEVEETLSKYGFKRLGKQFINYDSLLKISLIEDKLYK